MSYNDYNKKRERKDLYSRDTETPCRGFPRLRKFLARNFLQMSLSHKSFRLYFFPSGFFASPASFAPPDFPASAAPLAEPAALPEVPAAPAAAALPFLDFFAFGLDWMADMSMAAGASTTSSLASAMEVMTSSGLILRIYALRQGYVLGVNDVVELNKFGYINGKLMRQVSRGSFNFHFAMNFDQNAAFVLDGRRNAGVYERHVDRHFLAFFNDIEISMARFAGKGMFVYFVDENLVLGRAVLQDDDGRFAGLFPDFFEFYERYGNGAVEASFGP